MGKKIIFVDYLRVIAFISVAVVHWLSVFWTNPSVITMVTGAPELDKIHVGLYDVLTPSLPVFNFGQFGVSLFFLISGLVIPFSLEKKTTSGFFKSRLSRIYPTYIACCILSLIIAYVTAKIFWDTSNTKPFVEIITSLTLTNSLFHTQAVDWVNWTLSVEIKFYIICIALKKFILGGRVDVLFLFFGVVLLFSYITSPLINYIEFKDFVISIDGLRNEFIYCLYMMIGVLFNLNIKGKINTFQLYSYAVIMFSLFVLTIKNSNMDNQLAYIEPNYIYSLILFSFIYSIRNIFIENKIILFFSAISYPFYALHSIVGYVSIRILYSYGLRPEVCAIIAFFIVSSLSYLVYISVDKWAVNFGKKIK
ncbi:acyltransferase family protein [Yersinia enterocolitica]|uniref:acyltransferase family protein n=1 Tax=Yersinia enterocolitica TaxID=630 RepID=UPI003D07AF6B